MSYSYYVKFVIKKDNTSFYYIDMCISKYLKIEYESAIIQDLILLNNKNKQVCTKIMSSFYQIIEK